MDPITAAYRATGKFLQVRHGLTSALYETLEAIDEMPEPTMGRVMDQVGRAYSTGTELLDRLERMGLVKRIHSARDRRVCELFLTDPGRFWEIKGEVQAFRAGLDLSDLDELLKRITSATKRVAAG